jgi:hypothetical protein
MGREEKLGLIVGNFTQSLGGAEDAEVGWVFEEVERQILCEGC